MKIIIALTNSTGKNIAFITDDLVVRSLKDVIALVQTNLIEKVQVVSGKNGDYIRTARNNVEEDNLDFISIPLVDFLDELKNGVKSRAANLYEGYLELKLRNQPDIIYIDGKARATKKDVFERLKPISQAIKDSAQKYDIDPNTLGAILIDEYIRAGPDDLLDILGRFGKDMSVGLAQVKMSTARVLISKGFYKAPVGDISDNELYDLLVDDKSSAEFAAAAIRMHVDRWKPFIDLKDRPEILGTLYSLGEKKAPHGDPEPSQRGKQIKNEFYFLVPEILK